MRGTNHGVWKCAVGEALWEPEPEPPAPEITPTSFLVSSVCLIKPPFFESECKQHAGPVAAACLVQVAVLIGTRDLRCQSWSSLSISTHLLFPWRGLVPLVQSWYPFEI